MVARILMGVSVLAMVAAAVGAGGYDLYLASTQWVLVAILLAVWGVFLVVEAGFKKT